MYMVLILPVCSTGLSSGTNQHHFKTLSVVVGAKIDPNPVTALYRVVPPLKTKKKQKNKPTPTLLTMTEDERDECEMWFLLPSMLPPWIR